MGSWPGAVIGAVIPFVVLFSFAYGGAPMRQRNDLRAELRGALAAHSELPHRIAAVAVSVNVVPPVLLPGGAWSIRLQVRNDGEVAQEFGAQVTDFAGFPRLPEVPWWVRWRHSTDRHESIPPGSTEMLWVGRITTVDLNKAKDVEVDRWRPTLVLQVLDRGKVVDNLVGLSDVRSVGDLWSVEVWLDLQIYSGIDEIPAARARVLMHLEERQAGLYPAVSVETL